MTPDEQERFDDYCKRGVQVLAGMLIDLERSLGFAKRDAQSIRGQYASFLGNTRFRAEQSLKRLRLHDGKDFSQHLTEDLISDLGLSVRGSNAVARLGVTTIGALSSVTGCAMRRLHGCGTVTIREIAMRLDERGLSLAVCGGVLCKDCVLK